MGLKFNTSIWADDAFVNSGTNQTTYYWRGIMTLRGTEPARMNVCKVGGLYSRLPCEIIEKVAAIIVNGLCVKHNAPNSNTRFNYAFYSVRVSAPLSFRDATPAPSKIIDGLIREQTSGTWRVSAKF